MAIKLDAELSGTEVVAYLLPYIAVVSPIFLSMLFPDSAILRFMLGGWRAFITLPILFFGAEWVGSKMIERSRNGNKEQSPESGPS